MSSQAVTATHRELVLVMRTERMLEAIDALRAAGFAVSSTAEQSGQYLIEDSEPAPTTLRDPA